jgi:hypothetical protein
VGPLLTAGGSLHSLVGLSVAGGALSLPLGVFVITGASPLLVGLPPCIGSLPGLDWGVFVAGVVCFSSFQQQHPIACLQGFNGGERAGVASGGSGRAGGVCHSGVAMDGNERRWWWWQVGESLNKHQ